MQRQEQSDASGGESCWPFTEGQPASAFKEPSIVPDEAEVLPEWTPPPAPPAATHTVHPLLAALLRPPRAPSLVVFGAGMVLATILIALVFAGFGLV